MDLLQLDPIVLFLGVFFSIVGFAYYRYGKKQENDIARYSGIALMIYPYFVTTTLPLVIIGLGLMALPKIMKPN